MQLCFAAIQGQSDFLKGFFGCVVGFAQVRKNHMLEVVMFQGRYKFPGGLIGKMACSALNALFQRPWIGPVFEHFRIVVALQDQGVAGAEMMMQSGGH